MTIEFVCTLCSKILDTKMQFRSFDHLRIFNAAARHLSFTAAADELNLTKGAVSYQIGRLEDDLGFAVFDRSNRGIALTTRGEQLWASSRPAYEALEQEIDRLRQDQSQHINIGLSTYFASRWLSPRLMSFITVHPEISLRLQPLVDLIDLRGSGIDMAIRWGRGDWKDLEIEPLFRCPAFLTAAPDLARQAFETLRLLQDRDGSSAWQDWHEAANLPYTPRDDELVIPDPNVRVQAVIDGQGVALNDALIQDEISSGKLIKASKVELSNYGYFLAYRPSAMNAPALKTFRDWIVAAAAEG